MSIKYGILSLLLFIIALFLAIKSYETWTRPIEFEIEKRVAKIGKKEDIPPPAEIQKDFKKANPHLVLSEKNIFHPDRKDFPVVTGPVAGMELTRKSMQRPQVVLYGVTISEDFQSATIANPGKPLKKGEREILTLKLGERIGEYKLAKISPDRIMLESAEDNFEVLLYDPAMPKKRVEVKTEVKPATVTSTLPTAPPPPAQVLPLRPAPMELPKPTPPREPSPERVIPPLSPRTATSPIASPQAPGTPLIALPPTPGEPPIISPPAPGAPPVSTSIEGIPPSPITVPQTPVNRGPGEN